MEREGEEDLDKDGWTHSWGRAYSSGATISNMRRYARDRAGWRGAATDGVHVSQPMVPNQMTAILEPVRPD